MKKTMTALMALSVTSVSAYGAGLDRSGQSVSAIFANSGTGSLTFSHVRPSVTGTDTGALAGRYDVGDSYSQIGLSYTHAVSDKFDLAVIFDQPFGANVTYGTDPSTSFLGGTGADLSSEALTIVGRYKLSERFSVFGGIKAQQVRAEVSLNGQAYRNAIPVAGVARAAGVDSATLGAALPVLFGSTDPNALAAVAALGGIGNVATLGGQVSGAQTNFDAGGYNFKMDPDPNLGVLIGAAYEIPDIALRFSATYHFAISNTADTVETLGAITQNGSVDYKTPQSVNLEFQTGIAPNTLLLASYRWSEFSAVDVVPDLLGSDLVNLDDGHRVTLGLARRFNEKLVGSVSLSWEPEDSNDLVSPLGPTNGLWGISIGGRYSTENVNISGGINYSVLGDARPEVGGSPFASFTDNSSLAVGFKAEFTF